MIFNIPLALLPRYRQRQLILRCSDPARLPAALAGADLKNVVYLQLPGLPADIDALLRWREPVPVDLVLADPAADFPLLYRYAKLLDDRPVRVTMPVQQGFNKAFKLACSLQFAIKLEVGQPDAPLIDELQQVLDQYLRSSTVAQPVEYFHSCFLSFYHREPVSLWTIQEQDPTLNRYVTDDGEEILPARLRGAAAASLTDVFWQDWQQDLLAAGGECSSCEYFANCGGYFKQPRRDYDCTGVKTLFRALQHAALELDRDLAAYSEK